jgi:hypothetical protein
MTKSSIIDEVFKVSKCIQTLKTNLVKKINKKLFSRNYPLCLQRVRVAMF